MDIPHYLIEAYVLQNGVVHRPHIRSKRSQTQLADMLDGNSFEAIIVAEVRKTLDDPVCVRVLRRVGTDTHLLRPRAVCVFDEAVYTDLDQAIAATVLT